MAKHDDLLNTAAWIYATTGADMDTCLNEAAELLASLSEGDLDCPDCPDHDNVWTREGIRCPHCGGDA